MSTKLGGMSCVGPALLAAILSAAACLVAALTAEEMEGQYEAVDGTGNTCAENPATLSVTRSPDHLAFDWPVPIQVYDGSLQSGLTYDLITDLSDVIVLRLEGDTRRTEAGGRVTWLLRPTADRSGYCWGRMDWPLVRCEDAYRRCGETSPIS